MRVMQSAGRVAFFFFSSRRRHTRSDRDWSSDVCSSDLANPPFPSSRKSYSIQAAFTVKEARELMHIPGVAFDPIDQSFFPPDIKKLPRVQRRIAEVLLKGTQANSEDCSKSWALDFLKAP